MATRAGGARGGSGSRISPRLAQSLTSTGLPRLTVKELEENAAALRKLRAQDFLDKRSGRSLAALDSEDDGEGDGVGSLTLGGDVKVSAAPNGRAKASKKQ